MKAWRLCRAAFTDLSGEGARLFGGRWNSPGRPLVYMAETAALAILEVRVHLDVPLELLVGDYVLVEIGLPDLDIESVAQLPSDPTGFGDAWLAEARTSVLRVPSVIVPESANLLLNPRHPAAHAASVTRTRPFQFDPRLWNRSEGTGQQPRSL